MVLRKKPVSISGDVYVKRLYTRFCIGAIHSPCLIFLIYTLSARLTVRSTGALMRELGERRRTSRRVVSQAHSSVG